jgi:hypothetical protein
MNIKTILLVTLLSVPAFAGNLTDGSFKGKGLWKSAAKSGTYEVRTQIANNVYSATYTMADGSQKQWSFEMSATTNDFFQVKSNGANLGSGYCLEKAMVCHYEISFGTTKLEETLTIQNDKLFRFGSKNDGTLTVMWQEAMDKE